MGDVTNFEIGSITFARIDSGYVQMSGLNRPNVFQFYAEDGTHYDEKVTLAMNPLLNIGMTGTLISADGDFVYVAMYAGRIARMNKDGTLVFFRSTFYPTDPPRINYGSDAGLLGEIEGPIRARFPVNAWSKTFYLLALGDDDLFLDAYSLEDGSYQYTIPRPTMPEDGCFVMWVTDRNLYSSCTNGDIGKWRRPAGDEPRDSVSTYDALN